MTNGVLEFIGENFNTTRRVKATSPRIVKTDDKVGISYVDLDGERRLLDVTDLYPEDPAELKKTQIPHIAQALRLKDLAYITWVVRRQVDAGATIIDVCVDEISVDPEARHQCMRWIVPVIQEITDTTLSIDSSDPDTIVAGLEAYDGTRNRVAINSVNLEEGRLKLIDLAKERNALLFANASGRDAMPRDAEERVTNLSEIMELMDGAGIPMEDRYLDPLAFPVGADSEFGNHYLDAVRKIREKFPEVHIFGGHSNMSFGLPRRRAINNAFAVLSILAGCDTLMLDPVMNPPRDLIDFKLASDVVTGVDEMSMRYIMHCRG